MDFKGMIGVMDRLLDQVKVAILANRDSEGKPVMRWMSPSTIRGREGFLYAISASSFAKTKQLQLYPEVMWMVQSKALDEVLTVKGRIQVLENPSLQQEVIEAIGGKLGTFWSLNKDSGDLVVLETILEEFEYFQPAKALKERVVLKGAK